MDQRGGDAGDIAARNYLVGVVCGLFAISIWASWMAITRLGTTTVFSAQDVTFLRYGTAGLLLLPVVIRKGLAIKRLGWLRFAILVCGAGAPYTFLSATGLRMAPAAHGGVLVSGVFPLFVALLSALIFGEKFSRMRKLGYASIVAGIAVILGWTIVDADHAILVSQIVLLSAAFAWASYTLVYRYSGLDPLHSVAIVSVVSAVVLLPLQFLENGPHLIDAPWKDVLAQAFYQGVIATILSLYLFGKAIALLGASTGSSFGALVPVLAALLAIPILGEWPSAGDWVGIALVSAGVYLCSRRPMPPDV